MSSDGRIWIFGDSHVGLGAGDERRMVAWLDRLARRGPRALYLNGDVFHYYIGNPKFQTPAVDGFLAKLRELRDGGVDVVWVEGNRDFFVRGSAAERAVSRVVDFEAVSAGPRRYFVVHGDMINDRDIPYRFWRAFSKNPVMETAVRLVPKRIARRIVDRVERKLARSNFKHKTRLPVELMAAYGRERRAEGHDVVVFGHFHHKLLLPPERPEVIVLPAWFEGEEALAISPETGEWSFEVA
ncbi:MAG: UDP-2,3-diacylglucosamine diphosphatase [Thermoanaerobaculia bacterium]